MARRLLSASRMMGERTDDRATSRAPRVAPLDAMRALELRVGRVHLLVDLGCVDRLIELCCGPLPLTRPLVLGVGFSDDRPVVCVSLTRAPSTDAGVVKAVLLARPGPVAWALYVDEVLGMVPVERLDHDSGRGDLPRWVGRARTTDARTIGWIDAEDMVRDLSGDPATVRPDTDRSGGAP